MLKTYYFIIKTFDNVHPDKLIPDYRAGDIITINPKSPFVDLGTIEKKVHLILEIDADEVNVQSIINEMGQKQAMPETQTIDEKVILASSLSLYYFDLQTKLTAQQYADARDETLSVDPITGFAFSDILDKRQNMSRIDNPYVSR